MAALSPRTDRRLVASAALVLVSLGALTAALIAQYGFGLQPCVLCLYQRLPYLAGALIGLVALLLAVRAPQLWPAGFRLAAPVFLIGAGIAAFHIGVEQHWWAGTADCGAVGGTADSFEALKAQLLAAPVVRCDAVAWSLFGISMAGYNALASLLLAIAAWRIPTLIDPTSPRP